MESTFLLLDLITSDCKLTDVDTAQLQSLCHDVMSSYKVLLAASLEGARHSCRQQQSSIGSVVDAGDQSQRTQHLLSDSSTLLDSCQVNSNPPSQVNQFQPIILASMIIEGSYICNFEIDTDASHTVISPEVYQKACLVAKQKPPLRGMYR